jgi:acetoacetate decarboxylase
MGWVKTKDELDKYYGIGVRKFIGANMLGAMFQTKPEIVRQVLPPPLEPADQPNGLIFIAEYPETNLGPGYKESALFLNCAFEGETGSYCLSMPIDSEPDRMHNGRDIFGLPKKMASIHLEKNGQDVHGWVERHKIRFVEIKTRLTGTLPNMPAMGPSFLFKAMPRIDLKPGFDGPVLLCRQQNDIEMKNLEIGTGEITLRESDADSWAEIQIINVIASFFLKADITMQPGRVIREVEPERFTPYYFKMLDMLVLTR